MRLDKYLKVSRLIKEGPLPMKRATQEGLYQRQAGESVGQCKGRRYYHHCIWKQGCEGGSLKRAGDGTERRSKRIIPLFIKVIAKNDSIMAGSLI